MLKLLLLGIGLLLLFEGILYFFLAGNLNSILGQLSKVDPQKIKTIFFEDQLSKVDPQKIKTISLIMTIIGACLIYFTFRFYGDL